ncbi:hyaluronoglucosaminidase [Streptomyces sp. NPDC008137]|uniref:hyaluronoglucosaminidase n=1 Tax=Streptomyces sp. NPDC008137 TaxID=3364813 RepID=UPI0036F06FD7
MAVGRRLFLGAFTAGAVTVATGSEEAAADDGYTQYAAPAAFYGASPTEYAVKINYAATSGDKAALNVTSVNPESSAMYLSGAERAQRGTLKITHNGYADGSDHGASGISINLRKEGTAAQGIFVTATDAPTKGALIVLRNNPGLEDFVVKGSGRTGIGIGVGATPGGQLHVVQRSEAPALLVEGTTRLDGTVRLDDVAAEPAKEQGGGSLFARGGALYWKGGNGKVTLLAQA